MRRLRENFDCVDLRVVDHRHKREFDRALRSRRNIVEPLYDRVGSALCHDVEVLQKHVPVAGDIEYSAARPPAHQFLLAKPWFREIQRDTILPWRSDGDVIAEAPNSVITVYAAICGLC